MNHPHADQAYNEQYYIHAYIGRDTNKWDHKTSITALLYEFIVFSVEARPLTNTPELRGPNHKTSMIPSRHGSSGVRTR